MTSLALSNSKKGLLYGFGINDADYIINERINGKRVMCPYYIRWISVVQRGNDPKEKARKPRYEQSTTSEDWRLFSQFKAWLEQQPYWQELSIDKDILVPGNKEYGPNTCVLVPSYINQVITIGGSRSETSIAYGVSKQKGKFHAVLNGKHLGRFLTWQEAHKTWQLAKAVRIEEAIAQYVTEPWFRTDVAEALTSRVWKLRLDASQGTQTFTI
ncbi:hypothetical protein D3C85_1104050 [compost metagenome]